IERVKACMIARRAQLSPECKRFFRPDPEPVAVAPPPAYAGRPVSIRPKAAKPASTKHVKPVAAKPASTKKPATPKPKKPAKPAAPCPPHPPHRGLPDSFCSTSGGVTRTQAASIFRGLRHNCFQIFLSRISALIHFSVPGVNLEAEV